MSGVVGPRPVPSAQFRIPVVALQARGPGGLVAVQFGEGLLNSGVFRRQIFGLFRQQEGAVSRIICDV